ncbi:hypothetical protein F2Q69_00024674 [Brassica cretica]|uniref:Uncharacterized protein n=1 Tax=Brassica cretica TaxID=69181 RepID=A0A8S9QMU8_BRACR|nr:hypothetical protein F2Q69_00024674 [Brassica cretica]
MEWASTTTVETSTAPSSPASDSGGVEAFKLCVAGFPIKARHTMKLSDGRAKAMKAETGGGFKFVCDFGVLRRNGGYGQDEA